MCYLSMKMLVGGLLTVNEMCVCVKHCMRLRSNSGQISALCPVFLALEATLTRITQLLKKI